MSKYNVNDRVFFTHNEYKLSGHIIKEVLENKCYKLDSGEIKKENEIFRRITRYDKRQKFGRQTD